MLSGNQTLKLDALKPCTELRALLDTTDTIDICLCLTPSFCCVCLSDVGCTCRGVAIEKLAPELRALQQRIHSGHSDPARQKMQAGAEAQRATYKCIS